MQTSEYVTKKFGLLLSLLVCLAPMMSNYVLFGPISIGDLFIFLVTPWIFMNIRLTQSNAVIIFLSLVVSLCAFLILYNDGIYAGFYRLAFYFILFFVVISQANLKLSTFFKTYKVISVFFALSIIFQWAIYRFLGISFPLQFPLPYYEPDTLKIIDHVFRSGGWLKEPSYFTLYITPLLFYLMLEKKYLAYIIISLAGVLSTSSLFFFMFLLSSASALIKNIRSFLFFLFATIIFSFTIYLLYDQLMEWVFFSRIVDIFLNGGTLNDRFSPVLDIIGLSESPFPNLASYNLVVSGGDSGTVWYNSFSSILAALGWVGIILISLNFMRLGIVYGVVLLALMLTSHIFSGVYSIFIAIAFIAIKKLNYSKHPLRKL